MVNFANPHLLYILPAAVILLLLLYWRMRFLRKKRLERFGNPSILTKLMPDVSKYLPAVKLVISLLAICALVIVLARPRTQGEATEEEMEGIEVMIAVDVSNSMNASANDDPKGISRLQRAKQVLNSLLGKLNNDRVGLIVFAGEAYTQLPLTPDFVSAKLYLNELSTGMIDNQGTSIGAAIEVAMNSFSGAKDVERAIIVITDAEDQIGDAVSMAETAHHDGIEVDVIGLGSGKGAQIPLDKTYTNWMTDENGQIVTTYLNEQLAQEIAKAGGGVYIDGASASALNELVKRLDDIKKGNLGKVNYTANDEQFPLFAWFALILIVIDCIFSNRKIGFLRKYNFFSRTSASILLLCLAAGASAQTPKPLGRPLEEDASVRSERSFIRQGNDLFNKGRYSDAEIMYRRALNANPMSEVAKFNQALAQIHLFSDNAEANQEAMANAVNAMQQLAQSAKNQAVAEWAAYNLGNVAFNQQNLQGALQGYKQALRKNPANNIARENMRYVQKMMQQQQNQNQDKQDQDKQDQEDKQDQKQDQQQQQQNQDQKQDQNKDKDKDQKQQEQNMSSSSRDQILNAVEKKDAAARARAAQQNAKDKQNAAGRPRGRNW